MRSWKKVAVAALAITIIGGAGAAWATQDRTPGRQQVGPVASDLGGSGPTESKFVPITPCRIADTRGHGGPIGSLQTRPFKVRGSNSVFASQGGKPGGCGIPAAATAVEVSITAVNPEGTGYLRAWPANASTPTATFLNFAGNSIGNVGTVAICNDSCPSNQDLQVKVYQKATQVVIDVQGYYTKPMAVLFGGNGALLGTAQSRVVSTTRTATGVYTVTFDREVKFCSYSATVFASFNAYANAAPEPAPGDENKVEVRTYSASGAAQDAGVYLQVTC